MRRPFDQIVQIADAYAATGQHERAYLTYRATADASFVRDSGVGAVLQYLSVIRHYDDFTKGIVDTSSLIYYGSFIVFFVFLTVRSIDSMRWRRA